MEQLDDGIIASRQSQLHELFALERLRKGVGQTEARASDDLLVPLGPRLRMRHVAFYPYGTRSISS
jgi:hypothetical protein